MSTPASTTPRTLDHRTDEEPTTFVKRISLTLVITAMQHLLMEDDGQTAEEAAHVLLRVTVACTGDGTVIGWVGNVHHKCVQISPEKDGPRVTYHPERGESFGDQVAVLAAICAYHLVHREQRVQVP